MIVLYHYSNPSIIRPAVDFVKQIIKKENTIIQTKNKWISHGRKNFTEEEARAKCAGYKYMSLECPTNKTNLKFGARMISVACPYYPMMIVRVNPQ